MTAFIDANKDAYGVESICKELPIAPSTYYEHKGRQQDAELLPTREQRDAWLRGKIRRNFMADGPDRLWVSDFERHEAL